MGLFSTIGSFTAGYLVGARRRTPVSPATALPPFDTRRVSEIMTSSPKTLPSDATLSAAAKIMEADDIGDVIVTDPASDAVIGIITDRDIVIKCCAEGRSPAEMTAGELGQGAPRCVEADADIDQVLRTMQNYQIRRVPVLDNNRMVGMISEADLARHLGEEQIARFVASVYATR